MGDNNKGRVQKGDLVTLDEDKGKKTILRGKRKSKSGKKGRLMGDKERT